MSILTTSMRVDCSFNSDEQPMAVWFMISPYAAFLGSGQIADTGLPMAWAMAVRIRGFVRSPLMT